MQDRRSDARRIWQAGVDAVRPDRCISDGLRQVDRLVPGLLAPEAAGRILIVGGGKAGAAMARALSSDLERLGVSRERIHGHINVPSDTVVSVPGIEVFPARPSGTNQPTEDAMTGAERILELAAAANKEDVMLCLLSGGGSALLPAPVEGISLADKQAVTALLHRCGASIHEMNAVRKHLSRIKGGGLVRGFAGRQVVSLIISDVVGDPLDVIASGPTAVDPTTFQDALAVLEKYQLLDRVPPSVRSYLRDGARGRRPETLKELPHDDGGRPRVINLVIASSRQALQAAEAEAARLGYRLLNLGGCLEGETVQVAGVLADVARGQPTGVCILSGGETTVTLGDRHGLGGRNQEFVLASLVKLGKERLGDITILSGGTDGEDGPTDAAGAIADARLLDAATNAGLSPAEFLARHDAYHFFEPLGGLLKTGLTQTNVMDIRVTLT